MPFHFESYERHVAAGFRLDPLSISQRSLDLSWFSGVGPLEKRKVRKGKGGDIAYII